MMKERKSAATIRRRQRTRIESDEVHNPRMSSASRHSTSMDEFRPAPPPYEAEGPHVILRLLASEKTLFLGLLAFRVTNALIIQTSFVPDEYWQSLEVAHKMAFGYGHKTWEWQEGIRGYAYPLVFATLYKMLSLLRLDSRILLLKLPRLLQTALAATGDLYLYKLSAKLSGRQAALWSLLCQLTSWFTFYCCTRTLTNSTEAALTTVALFYYPWPNKPKSATWKYVSVMGLACIVRPTAAVLWLPLVLWHVWLHRRSPWRLLQVFITTGLCLLYLSSLIDRIFYGRWLSVHYNFARVNVAAGIATFYGSNAWHWYLSQGIVIVLGTHGLIFILAVRNTVQPVFLGVIGWTVAVFSFLPHKEFRFLLPLLPLALHVCGSYLCRSPYPALLPRRRLLVAFLIMTNLPIALYTALIHQRGTLDVMKYLHAEQTSHAASIEILFLMPCHSTPYYSYIHQNVSMRFLHCEPNLHGAVNYTDEADTFYRNPSLWLSTAFPEHSSLPSHVVTFAGLQPSIAAFLGVHGYKKCAEFFHTHVPEGRVGATVVVNCHPAWQSRRRYARQRRGTP